MRDLNLYVAWNFGDNWEDIGIELGFDLTSLRIIARDNNQQCVACLRKTLYIWLQLNTDDATWKTLETAITNVNRAKLGLKPVNDVYGKGINYNPAASYIIFKK